jgi:hypothetical protein
VTNAQEEPKTEKKGAGFKLTDVVGRTVRALADAATEASVSSLRTASEIAISVAENLANNLADAVVAPATIAQDTIDAFFSTISPKEDEEDDSEDDTLGTSTRGGRAGRSGHSTKLAAHDKPAWTRPASARADKPKPAASEEESS